MTMLPILHKNKKNNNYDNDENCGLFWFSKDEKLTTDFDEQILIAMVVMVSRNYVAKTDAMQKQWLIAKM